MKRSIFVMLVLVALAFAGPMLLKNSDGSAFMKLPWQNDEGTSSNVLNSPAEQSFYKWQDENGTWHYSDNPNPQGQTETVTVNTNANLIQGLRKEEKEEEVVEEEKPKEKEPTPDVALPMTVPLDKVSKMIEDASNIQQTLENRQESIDRQTR